MSQHSLLNIQQISSRTFNQEPSIMDTSLQHFRRELHGNPSNSAKKPLYLSQQERARLVQQNEAYKNALTGYINRIHELQRGILSNPSQDIQIKELMIIIKQRENEIDDLSERYNNAIMGLQQTVQKNEMLYREVEKYKRKNQDIELNYSHEHNLFNKSQNLISNLSITKSNYEIEIVNMKESLVILQKEKKKVLEANEQYEEKLALLSQEIQRLRGLNEILRKESERLKLASKQHQEHIQKIQYENHENKQVLERLRLETRDLRTSNSNLSLQLQEYHEKIMYKETVVTDLQHRENRISQTLKQKDTQIKELQAKVQWYAKEMAKFQDELNRRINEHFQQLGKVKISLNQKANSQKKIQVEKEQIIREYNELILRFESLKRQHESIAFQKQAATKQLQGLSYQKTELIRQIEQRLGEREKMVRQNENLKQSLMKSQTNFKLSSDQKSKQYESTIRMFEQKERNWAKQFQFKYESLNEHKNKEIQAKINQINKLRSDLSARDNQIGQFRSQIANKATEIAQLKQSTMSQSTIIDNTKRDYEQKIKERTEIINEFKVKLQNYEKLVDQSRRERDMIFQEKNGLLMQLQKTEHSTENKNNQLRSYNQKIQTLNLELQQLQREREACIGDVDNYKRILSENEAALKQSNNKLKESQSRILALTNQLQRISSLLQEKDSAIMQLNAHNRQISYIFQEQKGELQSLREINQKLANNLTRNEQSRGNFQMFMKQIERLNQVVSGKEGQLKHQRQQIDKIIQKIDILYQQQVKIIRIIENTYTDDARRGVQLINQLAELKNVILRLNENTSGTLNQISEQSGSILDILNHNDSEAKNINYRMNEQLLQAQGQLSKKDQELHALRRELQDLNLRLKQKTEQQPRQQQIFEKLIELTQQNAAIKEQLNYGKGQYEMELEVKNQSIIQLQSKVNLFEKKQKKQIQQLKAYINQKQLAYNQKQLAYNETTQRLRIEKQGLFARQAQNQNLLTAKQRELELLKAQKMKIQKTLDHLVVTINPRLSQLQKTNELLAINTREIQRYKQLVRNFEAKSQNYESRIQQSNRISILQREIQKLQKILEIRNAQISSNQEIYFKLKTKLNETQREQLKQKALVKQLTSNVQTLTAHIQQLQQSKFSSQKGLQSVSQLKYKNNQLHKELKTLQLKLSQSQNKLDQANNQINNLKIELSKIIEMNSNSIHAIALFQQTQAQKSHLFDKIHSLEDQLDASQAQLRSIQIQYDFMSSNQQQTKIHLHAYEFKTNQLEKEYLKLKQILANLNNQNSKLLTKNHFFEVELKKAQILQQKIQVLNGQINRLSSQNIDLSEQVTSCKLALGGQHSLEKKSEEQLALIVLLFVEIQALRNRVSQKEQHYSHGQPYRYRG